MRSSSDCKRQGSNLASNDCSNLASNDCSNAAATRRCPEIAKRCDVSTSRGRSTSGSALKLAAVLAAALMACSLAASVDAIAVHSNSESEAHRSAKHGEYHLSEVQGGSEPRPVPMLPGLPDVRATVGHLLHHRLAHYPLETLSSVSYKVTQAGSQTLPRWLTFDDAAATLLGIPLPRDVGRVYISVRGSDTEEIFALDVVAAPERGTAQSEQCTGGCPLGGAPLLANMLLLINFGTLSALQRVLLFRDAGSLLDIAPSCLFVRFFDWTNEESTVLWSRLDVGVSPSASTVIAFGVGCGSFEPDTSALHQTTLRSLERSLDGSSSGIAVADANTIVIIDYPQWFVTSSGVLSVQSEAKGRGRRQALIVDLQGDSNNTVLPSIEYTTASGLSYSSAFPFDSQSIAMETVALKTSMATSAVPPTHVVPSYERSLLFPTVSPSPLPTSTSIFGGAESMATSFLMTIGSELVTSYHVMLTSMGRASYSLPHTIEIITVSSPTLPSPVTLAGASSLSASSPVVSYTSSTELSSTPPEVPLPSTGSYPGTQAVTMLGTSSIELSLYGTSPSVPPQPPSVTMAFSTLYLEPTSVQSSSLEAMATPLSSIMYTPSPSAELTSPSAELTSPSVELTSPSIELTSPSVELTSPSIELTSPSVGLTSPSAELTSPSVELTSLSVELTSPSLEMVSTPSLGSLTATIISSSIVLTAYLTPSLEFTPSSTPYLELAPSTTPSLQFTPSLTPSLELPLSPITSLELTSSSPLSLEITSSLTPSLETSSFTPPLELTSFLTLSIMPSSTPSLELTPSLTPSLDVLVSPITSLELTPPSTPSLTPPLELTSSSTLSLELTPSLTPSHELTPTMTPSLEVTSTTLSLELTPSLTPSHELTPTMTPSLEVTSTTLSLELTPSLTPSHELTPTMIPSLEVTSTTLSLELTPSLTPSLEQTSLTLSLEPTPSSTRSLELTPHLTPSLEPTQSTTRSLELTPHLTPSLELTPSSTLSLELTSHLTPSLELTPSSTPSLELTSSLTLSTLSLELTTSPYLTPSYELTPSLTPSLEPISTTVLLSSEPSSLSSEPLPEQTTISPLSTSESLPLSYVSTTGPSTLQSISTFTLEPTSSHEMSSEVLSTAPVVITTSPEAITSPEATSPQQMSTLVIISEQTSTLEITSEQMSTLVITSEQTSTLEITSEQTSTLMLTSTMASLETSSSLGLFSTAAVVMTTSLEPSIVTLSIESSSFEPSSPSFTLSSTSVLIQTVTSTVSPSISVTSSPELQMTSILEPSLSYSSESYVLIFSTSPAGLSTTSLPSVSSQLSSLDYSVTSSSLFPTSSPLPSPTSSPLPSPTSSPLPSPTSSPPPSSTSSPLPSPASSPPPSPTSSPLPSPTSSPPPSPTSSPLPSSTSSPLPSPTSSPLPSPTSSPLPSPLSSPLPSPTSSPLPLSMPSILSSSLPPSPLTSSTSSLSPTPSTTPSPTPCPYGNKPPVAASAIGIVLVNEGQLFQFTISKTAFVATAPGNLTLTLLDTSGNALPNTSWVQLRGSTLEGVALRDAVVMGSITDLVLVVRASDDCGGSAYNFVTIRVIPQPSRVNFLLVHVEGDYLMASQSLSTRIRLVQRLAAFGGSTNPRAIYVAEFREGTVGVLYANLSISDFECEAFRSWTLSIYAEGNYTWQFRDAILPFVAAKVPSLVGPCSVSSFNITPTLGSKATNISSIATTETTSLLETIVPLVVVAFLLLAAGIAGCLLYRFHRPERKHLYGSRSTYLNRQPVYMNGELNLPIRRRGPLFIQGEGEPATLTRERAPVMGEHGYDHPDRTVDFSDEDDELVNVALLAARQPVWQHASTTPPYRLPPVCVQKDGQLAQASTDYSGLLDGEDGGTIEMGPDTSSEEEGGRHSPPEYRLPESARLL